MPKQSHSSYIRYVRIGCLMTKNTEVLSLLESLNDSRGNGEYAEISHLDSKLLYTSRAAFVVLLLEAAYRYVSQI